MRPSLLTKRAKAMRLEATEPEIRLWLELRAKRFAGVKFRRQKVIGKYIADFASRSPMLVIEIDGDTHDGREAYDATRTAYLESAGYQVLRFTNYDVMTAMEGVLMMIEAALQAPLPTLSPEGERAR